jgi:hypothetical protein
MRHSQLTLALAILAVVTGCAHPNNASVTKTLRWRFHPGQKFHICITRTSEHFMTGDIAQSNERMETIFDELWSVESVDNHGTAQITMTINRIRMKTKSPKGDIDFDSVSSNENMPKEVAFEMISLKEFIHNLKLRLSIDNRGQVLTAETNNKAPFPGMLEEFSEKGIKRTLKQMIPVLPESSLVVGDTWDDTLEFNRPKGAGFQKEVNIKYHYDGPTLYKNIMLEKFTTEATLNWGESPQGITVKVESQENPGVIYFDGDAGRLVEIKNSHNYIILYTVDSKNSRERYDGTSRIEVNLAP